MRIRPAAIGLFVVIAGCSQATRVEATLYFADKDLRYLVPISRPVSAPREALPARLVSGLIEPPEGLTSVLPLGTTVTSVTRAHDMVTVTVKPPATGFQGAAMVQEAMALTLVGVDGIMAIRLLGIPKGEEGLDFSQPTGRPIHPNGWLEAGEEEGTWVSVCWQTRSEKFLVPVSVPAASDSPASRLAVWQAGPRGGRAALFKGLWPSHPPLRLGRRHGPTIAIGLPSPLPKLPWERALPALAWTLTETVGIEHVRLEGAMLPPGVGAEGRLDRPTLLNVATRS